LDVCNPEGTGDWKKEIVSLMSEINACNIREVKVIQSRKM